MKLRDNYPEGNRLWFNDFYLKDIDSLIFSAGNFNGLYEFSLKEKKLIFLGIFKNENILERQLYGEVHRYKDKLVFIPLSAVNIAIYDLNENEFDSVALPFPKASCGFECKFLNSTIYNDRVFMFPGYAPYIIEFDMTNRKIVEHNNWYKQYITKWGKKSNLLFSFDMVKVDDTVYLPSAQHNGLFKYNIGTNEYQFIDILSEFNRVSTLAYDGEYFWCSTDNGKLLRTDLYGKVSEQIDIYLKFGINGSFVSSVYDDGDLWLFSSQVSNVLRIRCNDLENDFEIITYSEVEKEYTSMEYHTVNFVKKKEKYIFFMSRSDRKLKFISKNSIGDYLGCIIDKTGYSDKCIDDTDVSQSYMDHMCKRWFYCKENEKQLLVEQSVFSGTLDFFIKIVKERSKKEVENFYLNIGTAIYEHSKKH